MLPNDPKNRAGDADDSVDVYELLDEDTGFPQPEHLEVDDLAATQEVLRTANYLTEMESTTGWAILTGFLGEEINTLLYQLRRERDQDKIRRLQCLIESLELLPQIVDKLKGEAAKAQEVLNAYTMSATETVG